MGLLQVNIIPFVLVLSFNYNTAIAQMEQNMTREDQEQRIDILGEKGVP